jgi:hypothetical protein
MRHKRHENADEKTRYKRKLWDEIQHALIV